MTTTTITTRKCDSCGLTIDESQRYVNAMAYGVEFHIACVGDMSAARLIVLLGLDDIKIVTGENWDGSVKANSYYRNEVD